MTIFAILLLIIAVAIAFSNMQMVTLHLYFMTVSSPLWLIIVGAVLLGILTAVLFAGARVTSSRKNIARKEEELKEKLNRKDAELQASQQETKEVAEKTRNEMERALSMKQKDEEIKSLQLHLDMMEKKMQQQTTIHTDQLDPSDDMVIRPNQDPTTSGNDAYPNSALVGPEVVIDPNQSTIPTSDKQDVDPSNRI